MTHVLFHALGLGHTCAWPSVMGGYGCTAADSLTAQDAIGWALGDQISGTLLGHVPAIGLAASLRGERELERTSFASQDCLSVQPRDTFERRIMTLPRGRRCTLSRSAVPPH